MLLLHILRLLARALVDFPSVISGNWISVLLPIIIFSGKEASTFRKGGWPAVKQHIQRDTWIMGAVYLVLFGWVVVRIIYQDHSDLVARSRDIGAQLEQTRQNDRVTLQQTKDSLGESLTALKIECGIKEGMNRTLSQQNRDQQNLIANCQNEAIKRLAPDPFKITPLLMEPAGQGIGE
jgi:hypothetical protein